MTDRTSGKPNMRQRNCGATLCVANDVRQPRSWKPTLDAERRATMIKLVIGCALFVVSVAVEAAEPPSRSVPAEHPEAAPGLTLTTAGQLLLNNDPAMKLLLREGRWHLEAGRHIEGLTALQRILDRGDDGFVRSRAEAELVSVRFETLRLISELPPAGLAIYERLFGTQAKQLWEQGRVSNSVQTANEVLRRYFHAASGYEAARWLASRWMDRGEWSVAGRLYDRVLFEPAHRSRVTADLRFQAAIVLRQSRREERAVKLLESLKDTTVRFAGESQMNVGIILAAKMTELIRHELTTEHDWRSAAGSSERNVTVTGSVPWLKPMWSAELLLHPGEKEATRRWLDEQLDEVPQRVSVASEPLVVGDQVLFRDANGIRSVDVRSGQTLWRTQTQWPLIELQSVLGSAARIDDNTSRVESSSVGNSGWGHLASDGQMAFAVDFLLESRLEPPVSDPKLELEADEDAVRVLTRLIGVPLYSESGVRSRGVREPAWVLDGRQAAAKMGRQGSTVHFHGPPAVVDGTLYLIGESFTVQSFDARKDCQLNLLAVSAATGELLWWQGLALVNLPYFHRDQAWRQHPIGTPTASQGMLVCPTDTGLTFGIDLVTGRQRWVFDETFVVDTPAGRGFRTGNEERQRLGWPGLPAWPVIHGQRVILLPRFSEFLHCLDLATGQVLWRVPRGDALFVGSVTDELVLLVGDREVRAIPLGLEGHKVKNPAPVLWSQRLGTVTGRGVRVGASYLLPLKSGRIACLDLATGRERGHALRSTRDATKTSPDFAWADDPNRDPADWPGNLIAAGDSVLSMGPTRITAYPQAESALAELRQQPASVEQRLNETELSLLMNINVSPVAQLQKLLREPLSAEQRISAETLLRESLSLELASRPQDADELLAAWQQVARTPDEQTRLLRRTCEVFLTRDALRTVRAVRELNSLHGGTNSLSTLSVDLDETGLHVEAPETWAAGLLQQLRERLRTSPDLSNQVAAAIRAERDSLLTSTDVSRLRRFVRVYGEWPETSAARLRLADVLIEQGSFQEAEFLLSRERSQSDPGLTAAATARTAQLWDRLGLHRAAAKLLDELEERFGDQPFMGSPDGESEPTFLTGREFVSRFVARSEIGHNEKQKTKQNDGLTRESLARRQTPDWRIRRVAISEERGWTESGPLLEAFGQPNESGQRPRTPAAMSFDLAEVNSRGLLRRIFDWQVIDKESGVVVGQLSDMARMFQPGFSGVSKTLHFVPMASSGVFRGVSLLERDDPAKTWEYRFGKSADSTDFPRVGPYGPEFCAFQTKQHLVVLDPVNGRLLWRRGPLNPQAGLFAEHETGLFGDREVLVLFESDFTTYTAYETLTGRELRRGKLSIDIQQGRKVVGRRLLFQGVVENQRRIRLWDPLTDRFDLDDPIGKTVSTQPHSSLTDDGELLLVLPNGRVRLIDVERREVKLDVTLPANSVMGLNAPPRAFADRDRIYINLKRGISDLQRRFFSAHMTDTPLPKIDIEGELHVFARPAKPELLTATNARPLGRHLWTRLFPPRSVLRLDNPRLPFLVLICQRRERQGNSPMTLHVETLDAATGNQNGEQSQLQLDRLVQSRLDVQTGRLSLLGVNTSIHLDFGPNRQLFDLADEPL